MDLDVSFIFQNFEIIKSARGPPFSIKTFSACVYLIISEFLEVPDSN